MIRHAVFFRFKDEIADTQQQQHINDFASLRNTIAEIAGYEWGNVIAGPDAKGPADYHVAHYVMFSDLPSLETYIEHPDHRRFVDRNRTSWDSVKVVDSEVSE